MSTAAVSDIKEKAQLRLPRMGKYKVRQGRLAFAGALVVSLTSDEDVELFEATGLGATGTVTFSIDGSDREIVLGWRSVDAGGGFRKLEGDETVVGRRRIVINDAREGDDEPVEV